MGNAKNGNMRVNACTIVQQMKSKFFNGMWNDTTTIQSYMDDVVQRAHGHIKRFAIICHDKDTRFIKATGVEEKKPKHFHAYLEFDKKFKISDIANFIAGVEPQFIETIKRGRYGKENALAYLIHAKQPEKHHYDATEVYTTDCQPLQHGYGWYDGWYQNYYEEHADAWESYMATAEKHHTRLKKDVLLKQVLNGEIDINNLILTDEGYQLYADDPRSFDNAFNAYMKRKSVMLDKALRDGDIDIRAIYIYGETGIGKTQFIDKLQEASRVLDANSTWYKGSSTHPLDNYKGEDYVVLDDVHANAFTTKEWLQLLDPHHNFDYGGARYHMKSMAAHTIIIVSTKSPEQFFEGLFKRDNEPLNQLLRRLYSILEIKRVDGDKIVEVSLHDSLTTFGYKQEFKELDKLAKTLIEGGIQHRNKQLKQVENDNEEKG